MPYDDVQYEPTTGARLTPQYGDPTPQPSAQGMTLPERYARAKLQQTLGLLTGPGRVAAGQVPMYAIDASGQMHTSPQALDMASALATLAKTSPRAITTTENAAYNPSWWQSKVAGKEADIVTPDTRGSDAVTMGNSLSQLALMQQRT